MSVTEFLLTAECNICKVKWNPKIETHICGLSNSKVEQKWEYEVFNRPTEIILVIYKKDESTRGYIRFTEQEELDEWLKIIEKICVKREL